MAADAARFAATGREARPLLADAAGVGAAAVPDTAQGASKYLMRKSLQWQLAEAQAGQHAAESQLSALHAKVAAAEEVQEQAEERARREAGRRHALDGELGQLKQQLRRADSRLERAAAAARRDSTRGSDRSPRWRRGGSPVFDTPRRASLKFRSVVCRFWV